MNQGPAGRRKNPATDTFQVVIRLTNEDGLHARPAASFAKLAGSFQAAITVNGVDAKSLLKILSLGLGHGSEATIEAKGTDARPAVDALAMLIRSFGDGNGSPSPSSPSSS